MVKQLLLFFVFCYLPNPLVTLYPQIRLQNYCFFLNYAKKYACNYADNGTNHRANNTNVQIY